MPGSFAPTAIAWGTDNRTCALRVVGHGAVAARREPRAGRRREPVPRGRRADRGRSARHRERAGAGARVHRQRLRLGQAGTVPTTLREAAGAVRRQQGGARGVRRRRRRPLPATRRGSSSTPSTPPSPTGSGSVASNGSDPGADRSSASPPTSSRRQLGCVGHRCRAAAPQSMSTASWRRAASRCCCRRWATRHDRLSAVDGLVLAGGADVDPARTAHEPHREDRCASPDRDGFEFALLERALRAGTPVLGVCRGLQVLNVALGGTLVQHLPEHVGTTEHQPAPAVVRRHRRDAGRGQPGCGHPRRTTKALCYHHQAVDRLGAGLVAVGWAADGTVEAAELPGATSPSACSGIPSRTRTTCGCSRRWWRGRRRGMTGTST